MFLLLSVPGTVSYPAHLNLDMDAIVFSAAAKIEEAIIELEVEVYQHSSCQLR